LFEIPRPEDLILSDRGPIEYRSKDSPSQVFGFGFKISKEKKSWDKVKESYSSRQHPIKRYSKLIEKSCNDTQKRFISYPMGKLRKIQRSDNTPIMGEIFLIYPWIIAERNG